MQEASDVPLIDALLIKVWLIREEAAGQCVSVD